MEYYYLCFCTNLAKLRGNMVHLFTGLAEYIAPDKQLFQPVQPKRRYISIRLRGVISEKTAILQSLPR
jgi:hypothetical protein